MNTRQRHAPLAGENHYDSSISISRAFQYAMLYVCGCCLGEIAYLTCTCHSMGSSTPHSGLREAVILAFRLVCKECKVALTHIERYDYLRIKIYHYHHAEITNESDSKLTATRTLVALDSLLSLCINLY